MKIIGLFGKADQGKTTTLNQVIEKLKQEGGEIKSEVADNGKDRHVCIEYKGKRICIASDGDNEPILQRNCDFFDECNRHLHIDVAVSATRTRNTTRKVLEQYAKEQKTRVTWIKKRGSADKEIQTELNNIDTYLVLNNILADIDGNNIAISQSFQFKIS